MAFWNRRRRADQEQLRSYQEQEQKRREMENALELKRLELKQRTVELEFENLERRTKAEIERETAAAELKEKKRGWARKAREKVQEQRTNLNGAGQIALRHGNCRVCLDPSRADLTAQEIQWHWAGHPASWLQQQQGLH
jgi:hypothetical protein